MYLMSFFHKNNVTKCLGHHYAIWTSDSIFFTGPNKFFRTSQRLALISGTGKVMKIITISLYIINKIMYPQYIVLGKWGIVYKGVYFTTKHVKRVHIRCRCTCY